MSEIIQEMIETSAYEEAEIFLEEKVKNSDYTDSESLINLILLLIRSPLNDDVKGLHYANRFSIKGDINEKVALLKVHIEAVYRGEISSDSLQLIKSIKPGKYRSCFDYLLAWQFEASDYAKAIQIHQKISDANKDFVKSHYALYKYYKKGLDTGACKVYSRRIVEGVNKVYALDEGVDIFNYDEFVNESILGTYLSKVNFEEIFMNIVT